MRMRREIGVTVEANAHQVVDFAFGPVGALKYGRQTGHSGRVAVLQRADEHQMLLVFVGAQLVGGEEAAVGLVLGQLGLVDGTDVEQRFVGQVRIGLDEFGQRDRGCLV